MAIVFTCRSGSLAGQQLQFSEPVVTFGRKSSNMVRFSREKEPGVSNIHCEVFRQDDAYFVRDMGSANGTFVDGVQVKTPVSLHDGSVIHFGHPGPEFVVSIPEEQPQTMMMDPRELAKAVGTPKADRPPAAPPGAAGGNLSPASEAKSPAPQPPQAAPLPPPPPPRPPPPPPPPVKDGIGMFTLMTKLDLAKMEAQNEYNRRMRRVYIGGAVVLAAAVALVMWVKLSSDRKIRDMQEQWLAQVEQAKRDAESRYNEITKNTDASTQTKLEQLQKLLNEKTAFVQGLAADAKKVGVDAKAVSQEMIRNREALKDIQAQIGDLTAFVSFKERYSKCVYSLALRFTEGGAVKHSFVGSAFSLSSDQGLLGTTARVVEAVKPLLEDKTCQLIARCDGDAHFSYAVTQTHVHPEFKRSESGVGKDVALLKLDLRCLRPDGTPGTEQPLPAALQPAGDDELEQVVSGVNVAVFGFSDLDRAKLEGETPAAGVATLSTNIVDGTYSFAGERVAGRAFGLLKHNCAVMKGFAGAPVVNTKNHVVAVQSNTITLAAARGGLQIPAPNSACAVSIKTLLDLQAQFARQPSEAKQ